MFNATDVKEDASLFVDYDMHLTGLASDEIVIKREEIESDVNPSISLYAIMHIPFKFKVIDEVNVNLKELMNDDPTGTVEAAADSDLFGRTEASGLGDMDKYLTAFRAASIIYKPSALPFYAKGLSLQIDMTGSGDPQTKKFARDVEDSFKITKADLEKLLTIYPLNPDLALKIEKDSDLSLPRDIKIDIAISLKLETDGPISIIE